MRDAVEEDLSPVELSSVFWIETFRAEAIGFRLTCYRGRTRRIGFEQSGCRTPRTGKCDHHGVERAAGGEAEELGKELVVE